MGDQKIVKMNLVRICHLNRFFKIITIILELQNCIYSLLGGTKLQGLYFENMSKN